MDFLNINAVIFILYFVTPGVVATRVHDLIIPSEQRDWGKMSFDLVSYSAVNLFFFYLLTLTHIMDRLPVMNVPLLVSNKVMDFRPVLFVSFLIPIAIGFLSGIVPKSVWFHRLLGGMVLNPEPSPWDFIVSNKKRCYGILFHLKSGSKVGGIYGGSDSYVSSFPHPKEIYVRYVCNIDENGKLLSVRENSAGMFISMDEVSLIELFDIPSKQRSSTWQKIRTWLSDVSSRLPHRRNKKLSKEKDEGQLQNLTLVSSQSGEVELSHSSLQMQPTKVETGPQTPPSRIQVTKVEVAQTSLPQTQITKENKTAS